MDREAHFHAERAQEGRISLPALPQAEVPTPQLSQGQMPAQLFHKLPRLGAAHLFRELLGNDQLNAQGSQQLHPLIQGRQVEASTDPLNQFLWVRMKGKYCRAATGLTSGLNHFAKQPLMAPMHPVKYADGQPGRRASSSFIHLFYALIGIDFGHRLNSTRRSDNQPPGQPARSSSERSPRIRGHAGIWCYNLAGCGPLTIWHCRAPQARNMGYSMGNDRSLEVR